MNRDYWPKRSEKGYRREEMVRLAKALGENLFKDEKGER